MSMKHGLGFRKDNANESKGHLSLLEMDFVEPHPILGNSQR